MSTSIAAGDGGGLEALFDGAVAGERASVALPLADSLAASDSSPDRAPDLLTRIGQLTRAVHDGLRGLGYDKKLEAAAATIPDARARLAYVATLTERAALRVMNAADRARPIQDELGADANALAKHWHCLFAGDMSVDQFKALAAGTLAFLESVPKQTQATNAQLTEIVLAQDYQDLTGQVLARINDLAHYLEKALLLLLLEHTPADQRPAGSDGLLNGPVVNIERSGDVVTTQAQVDDLLASLGF